MIAQIIIGLVGIVIGVIMVVYARWIVTNIGLSATLERYLGGGGTYTGLRIIGICIIFLSFLFMIGYLDDILKSIWKTIFG